MKSELITGFALLLMLGSLIVGVAIYYKDEVNQCTSNPLLYGAKQMEERFGYEFVGTGYFITPINVNVPRVHFNNQSISFQK